MCWCTPGIRTPKCSKPGCERPVQSDALSKAEGWAAWHPKQGFKALYIYEGALVYLTLDDAVRLVRELNSDEGTTNRNGWRAVKVKVERVL